MCLWWVVGAICCEAAMRGEKWGPSFCLSQNTKSQKQRKNNSRSGHSTTIMATSMPPPLVDETSTQSIYTFPFPSANRSSNDASSIASKTTTPIGGPSSTASPKKSRPNYVCSEIPQMTALHFLHRRLLLPTFIIPVGMLSVPPLLVSTLAFLAYHVTGTGGS